MMLRLDEPEIAYLHPNECMKATGYASIDFQVSYKAYSQQREELLGLLRNISAEAWSRPARIRGRTHTVFSETRRMTLHEADHWLQIDRLYKV
jgi:hypothetical protein